MAQPKSILDKIIQSKNIEEASQFNPTEIISDLVKELNAKEREVLSRRFGLNGEPLQTLEEIGKNFEITRERIRQIQGAAVRKVRVAAEAKQRLAVLEHTVTRLLHEHGGIAEAETFYRNLLSHLDESATHRQAAIFIITELLPTHVERVRQNDQFYHGWKHRVLDLAFVQQTIDTLRGLIEGQQRSLKFDDLITSFKGHDFYLANRERFVPAGITMVENDEEAINRVLLSYLTISRQIEQNILGEWGLSEWPTIRPRRMGDKIYLVLKQGGKPLHFTEITEEINRASFDHKVAYPATIHNELILDERYVLVGRGIYALREWGYEPGTVGDVIMKVLTEAGKPLTRDEIVNEVSRRRFVRKSTIYLALTNREHFAKIGDRYQLKPENQAVGVRAGAKKTN
ncbi:MAG: sigma factor-like helix-turn-helix DNA-binding protein [Patescibacteria group bacterium]|nr:sigma factor-like helix-turn-helix DNA-binding protein [Patescibacteria group bacterium]